MKALSGQVTVTAAGTAYNFLQERNWVTLMIKAKAANTGVVVVGNDGAGDVTTSNGMQLSAKEAIIYQMVNMSHIWVDAATKWRWSLLGNFRW